MTILVAGIGNIFFADDGVGVEVARRLDAAELPEEVTVTDYGIRGMHLAFDLLDGYDTTILIDAVPRGGEPGTIYVVDVTAAGGVGRHARLDPHGMTPDAVLDLLASLGGTPGQVYLVGIEPQRIDEQIGLSPPVADAVDTAVAAVLDLIASALVRAPSKP